jgi:hypothetical protein
MTVALSDKGRAIHCRPLRLLTTVAAKAARIPNFLRKRP